MSEYYVYVLLDPRKPGIYIYEDLLFFYEPYYVGKGKDNRYKRHCNLFQLNSGSNLYKERKLKKIITSGFDPTKYVELIFFSLYEEDSLNKEQEIINTIGRSNKKLGPLTNLTDGGEGWSGATSPFKNKTYEDIFGLEKAKQLKEEKSIRFTGSNNPMYGVSRRGFKQTEEAKRKLSLAKSKPVLQIDKNSGEIIKRFSSPKEASIELGISLSSIHNCLSPNQPSKSAGGFIWKYENG